MYIDGTVKIFKCLLTIISVADISEYPNTSTLYTKYFFHTRQSVVSNYRRKA